MTQTEFEGLFLAACLGRAIIVPILFLGLAAWQTPRANARFHKVNAQSSLETQNARLLWIHDRANIVGVLLIAFALAEAFLMVFLRIIPVVQVLLALVMLAQAIVLSRTGAWRIIRRAEPEESASDNTGVRLVSVPWPHSYNALLPLEALFSCILLIEMFVRITRARYGA